MDLSFFPLTLEAIDKAAAESLCLFIGADERPLTGLAGLADWRLSGRLSRLLRNGSITGGVGEAVLTPPGARLGFRKLFVFGLGPSGQDEAALAARLADGLRKIAQAGVKEAALQLPARLSAELGIRTLIEELQGPARAMVFSGDPQKLMAALSRAAFRGGGPQLERRVVKVPAPAPAAPSMPKTSPLPYAPQRELPQPIVTPPAGLPKALPSAVAQRQNEAGPIAQVIVALSAPAQVPAAPTAAKVSAERAAEAPEEPALPATGRAQTRGALEEEPALPATGGAQTGGALETDVPIAPALQPSFPPPASASQPPLPNALTPPSGTSQPPGKRPAPPPPPPPPPGTKRPPAVPPQRYVPPTPTQNVFDRSKRKKR